jgi:hypothetical protein
VDAGRGGSDGKIVYANLSEAAYAVLAPDNVDNILLLFHDDIHEEGKCYATRKMRKDYTDDDKQHIQNSHSMFYMLCFTLFTSMIGLGLLALLTEEVCFVICLFVIVAVAAVVVVVVVVVAAVVAVAVVVCVYFCCCCYLFTLSTTQGLKKTL